MIEMNIIYSSASAHGLVYLVGPALMFAAAIIGVARRFIRQR